MAGPLENFRFDGASNTKAQEQLSGSLHQVSECAKNVCEAPVKAVREHPVETGAALCLVGICVKNPMIWEAATETIEGLSAKVAVSVDDAVMASRKTVQFPIMQLGRDDALYLNQPAGSAFSKAYIRARQAVAKVNTSEIVDGETKNCNGTAFAVSRDGKFITNRHVVCGTDGRLLQDIKLVDRFGKEHPAAVTASCNYPDLAVLRLTRRSPHALFKPLEFGKGLDPGYHLNPKEEVFCFGHPIGVDALYGSVKSNVRVRWNGTARYERCGAAVIPIRADEGSSGSPLLNKAGEVTGIVVAGPAPNSKLHNSLTVGIPSQHAEWLLAAPDRWGCERPGI
jgi:S1-C subfamily serine protease